MLAENMERKIIHWLNATVVLNGVREDDELRLELFQEKARYLKLKRTHYTISTALKFNIDFQKTLIEIPVFDLKGQSFELKLISHQDEYGHSTKSRYLLKSINEAPFKLNGSICYEAFLERGDVVEIGLNRLFFSNPSSHLKLIDNEEEITSDVISSKLNVVIEGETGTGKSSLAKKIHYESQRAGEFVHLNLASFSPNLIESELFGHIKGAFTGAHQDKKGAILQAHRGTLFLDEIDSLSLDLQTKLLLFLDSQDVRAVGGHINSKVDVRLIFASGTPLRHLLDQQRMRKDFYYRLISGVSVELKSIRQNPERIKKLVGEWAEEQLVVIANDLVDFYANCSWPGNIRQLRAHLSKKKVLSGGKKIIIGQVDYDLLNDHKFISSTYPHGLKCLEEIKQDYCYNVYLKVDKSYKRASEVLAISPNTLKAMLEARSR